MRQAEFEAKAANAGIGVTIGGFLPKIGLSAIFGGVSPRTQIPLLLEAYRSGTLKLAELVTPYRLEDINQGYQDMRDGKNLRGVIQYTDADY